ncbi:MAG: hypothetical protein EOR30_17020 [Mesorhizobium sp.]|uniref:hypothetical protein n=1 Tax=unclassified Mesorhizobium TaxID=325217 RepID=UPI000FC9E95D|nr:MULTISPECIES: hypothetical protein [unclassified Mesorhizobium]RUV75931.1 hypothetical protein EOA78_04835 [Mesorhizobium sp. M5C.F.Cr.IN.023.01.1.1]RWF85782.1 MAG: hypothetical protein EOQ36_20975 [Mesorhizobium sp.]RWF95280.1 MAG: hypothetical protein EOQ45_08085 [Mesorhizobium sp.]RWI39886.1 MAG: hypothetical protein EOR14_17565 [Mesorhizobium sp.]RWI45249.1 MAG: hypothetical protein EOR15_22475 [Mesorhizobium sp.]
MTIWLCVTPERREKTRRIMEALHAGGRGATRIHEGAPPRGEPFVVWGHHWLAERIVPHAIRDKTPWWLIDNGFHLPANGEATGYYAITSGGMTPALLADCDKDRLLVPMAPWREPGAGHVLLALPGGWSGHMMGMDMAAWSRTIERRIRRQTDRPIVIREKGCKRPLCHDLAGAHVLVTHSSKAAIAAVVAGVPVIVEPTSAAAPMGSTKLADIERPKRPGGREAWWASLMAQQFTLAEMRAGLVSRMMRKVATDGAG